MKFLRLPNNKPQDCLELGRRRRYKYFWERGHVMDKRMFPVWIGILGLMFLGVSAGCQKEEKQSEGPKTEWVTVSLNLPSRDMKTEQFTLQLSGLEIRQEIDKATKEIVSTPSLRGALKLINQSGSILDVQGLTIQYLDKDGNPISFAGGEKNATVSAYWTDLGPGKEAQYNLDTTIPKAAVKDKKMARMELKVVYITTPLKRDVLNVPIEWGGK
jgi:hypothetical protein